MTKDLVPTSRPAGMTRGMTLLFAIACGAAVGNLYWAQPLLTTIADAFAITESSASLVITGLLARADEEIVDQGGHLRPGHATEPPWSAEPDRHRLRRRRSRRLLTANPAVGRKHGVAA